MSTPFEINPGDKITLIKLSFWEAIGMEATMTVAEGYVATVTSITDEYVHADFDRGLSITLHNGEQGISWVKQTEISDGDT
jgi:hypothetical protein